MFFLWRYTYKNNRQGASNEPPQHIFCEEIKKNRQGASNEYPQHIFLWRNKTNTVFTLSIRIPQLLTIYVLKFEPIQFTT